MGLCKCLSKVGLSRETNLFVFLLFLPALVVVHGTLFTFVGLKCLNLMINAEALSRVGAQQGWKKAKIMKSCTQYEDAGKARQR